MRSTWFLALSATATLLASCSSDAPQAPMGFDKRPANSASTISDLTNTPNPDVVVPKARIESAAQQTNNGSTDPVARVFIVSDFSAPGGISSLSPAYRAQLVSTARSAQVIMLYCRGDHVRPSRTSWNASLQRGIQVKRFLVAQGIDPAHIRLFVRSTSAFVAENTTSTGRARNRRVEIHFA